MKIRLRVDDTRWCLVATLLFIPILSACQAAPKHSENTKAHPVTAPAPVLTLQSLEMRVAKLEKQLLGEQLTKEWHLVSCKGGGFSTVETNNGRLLVHCEDVSPYLNGFKLKLQIGNPSTLTYLGIKLYTLGATPTDVSQDLVPGAWTNVNVVVAPATASDVSELLVKIETNKVSLRRAH